MAAASAAAAETVERGDGWTKEQQGKNTLTDREFLFPARAD